jgi:hypothetical protein
MGWDVPTLGAAGATRNLAITPDWISYFLPFSGRFVKKWNRVVKGAAAPNS